jgi:hypothetical protein
MGVGDGLARAADADVPLDFCARLGDSPGRQAVDLRVLVGSWSASPPDSLSLLPYGPRYPVDTGEFFIPSSGALLLSSFGALICGWQTPLKYRVWLVLPALLILVTLIFTVLWFWPQNRALWHVAIGAPDAIRDRAEIIRRCANG